MKPILFLIFFSFLITGCEKNISSKNVNAVVVEDKPIVIDSVEVLKKELVLNGNEGKWYYKDKPYNGYSLKYHPNGVLEEKWGF